MNSTRHDSIESDTICSQSAPLVSCTKTSDAAYELKFVVPDPIADQVLAWARLNLIADPHSDPSRSDGYHVNSLYLDTAGLDVYHRIGPLGRRKFRLRRYGRESRIFLERKSKSGGLVRKRRTAVPEIEIGELEHQHTEPSWPGFWFHRRMRSRKLVPKVQISYERVARIGMTTEGPIRLTVDKSILCRPAAWLALPVLADGVELLAGRSIVELKYRVALPALFKDLIGELLLSPGSVSKYRLSVEACALNQVRADSSLSGVAAQTPPNNESSRYA